MAGADSLSGIVIRSTGSWVRVVPDHGALGARGVDEAGFIECRLAGKFRLDERKSTHPIAVGDVVTVKRKEDGTGVITSIGERRNGIPRQSTHARQSEQVLISNLDRAWVVQAVREPRIKFGFIDRFLVTCEAYDVPAGLILNKCDLIETEEERREIQSIVDRYTGLGYSVLLCSAKTGEGIPAFEEALKGHVSAVIGPSGTGKTSLLNRIDPTLERKTAEVSDWSGKGKHTTTFAQLLPLPFGGMIADTPGIKEFGLVGISPEELSHYFPEMRIPSQECRYSNCTHEHEPGCGVREAFERGEIDPERYHSYLMMLDSLQKG